MFVAVNYTVSIIKPTAKLTNPMKIITKNDEEFCFNIFPHIILKILSINVNMKSAMTTIMRTIMKFSCFLNAFFPFKGFHMVCCCIVGVFFS